MQQSAIEETLKRIEKQPGVEGFIIVDDQGNVLRHRRDMPEEAARVLAESMWPLTQRAMHTVRDMNPTEKLSFFRLRMKEREIIAAPGPGYLVVVLQRWDPAEWKAEDDV